MTYYLPIKRLGEGYYLFGTKKIFAKVINNQLVVRVGGGYMNMQEFIDKHGMIELKKVNDLEAAGKWNFEEFAYKMMAADSPESK
jgi:TfoX/Sxy family transcriptional regulator of competence genes